MSEEFSIKQLAKIIISQINPELKLIHKKLPDGDPLRRKPLLDKAQKQLGWEAKIPLEEGLKSTIKWFREENF